MESNFINEISKFSDIGPALSQAQLVYALLMTLVLCLIVTKTYQLTYRGVSYSPAFMHTLVICGMVIAAVMIIIGSNIARAFSLVGALSIIRFRNAVKDPRDVAYIFLVMGVGMACGTGFYTTAIILTSFTCLCALAMYALGFGELGESEKLVRITAPQTDDFENVFNPILQAHGIKVSLLSVGTSQMGTELELAYSLKVKKNFKADKLIKDLSALNQSLKVQVLGTTHPLDL
jgi:uncharacterized membrane protein YhiD involved in acid resistance